MSGSFHSCEVERNLRLTAVPHDSFNQCEDNEVKDEMGRICSTLERQ
jgi:hypothetical protein